MEKLFTEYSAYYFFSAWLQADAALISIIVIFVIFRLQTLNSRINDLKMALFNMPNRIFPADITKFERYSPLEREEFINKKSEDRYTSEIAKIFKYWDLTLEKVDYIKKDMKLPILFLAIVLGFCGLALFMSNYIHSIGFWWECSITIFMLILNLTALGWNIIFIFQSLKE
jgi:hypothetical protein